ncbi:hypothetical protein GJAV_G00272430 [Gymnothorax javanicus]|nr:hypothetical protein GJAV_G00272430 [Gymnothorax javanicus]
MNLLFVTGLVFWRIVSSLRIMERPPLNCTQEGLKCGAHIDECSEGEWRRPRYQTPTGPQWSSEPQVAAVRDETGELVPVISVKWRARADGSISALKGSSVHILQQSRNESLCVFYVFHDSITRMMNPRKEAWSFSLDRVVVDPGQTYSVSISNLPVPDTGHNKIDRTIAVPGCSDPKLKETQVCRESGSLWEPNITSILPAASSTLTVRFNTGEFSEKYTVSIRCPDFRDSQTVWKGNETALNVSFAVDHWPETCCDHDIVVQPFFTRCSVDCAQIERVKKCIPDEQGHSVGQACIFLFPALLLGCGCFALFIKTWTGVRKPSQPAPETSMDSPTTSALVSRPESHQPNTPKRVLLLYSLDHPLYREVVLKLCSFLKAQCGTEVVLDLLDTAWLGAVGRVQWLDWQKQQIEKSSDKILILCSRGVHAKWKAMCGGGKVMLKEDVRSPMGDMLTPALNLIVPDFVHSTSFQKYIVAYFEDISTEEDIPAPFNVTIKYKLMKHFEELYFRILNLEKHEPGRVNRIEGIAQDEYFNWPTGRALRHAVETFQAYQLENPDWFIQECVDSEEEVAEPTPQHPLLADACRDSIYQRVPEFKEGPPVLVNEMHFSEEAGCIQTLTPVVDQGGLSAHEFHPGVHLDSQLCYSLPVVNKDPQMLRCSIHSPMCEAHCCKRCSAALQIPPRPLKNMFHPLGEAAWERHPLEDQEQEPASPSYLSLQQMQAPQWSCGPAEDMVFIPRGVVDHRMRPQSGSDQGYISRSSPQQGLTYVDKPQDPLDALCRLQEACLLTSLRTAGAVSEGEGAYGPD